VITIGPPATPGGGWRRFRLRRFGRSSTTPAGGACPSGGAGAARRPGAGCVRAAPRRDGRRDARAEFRGPVGGDPGKPVGGNGGRQKLKNPGKKRANRVLVVSCGGTPPSRRDEGGGGVARRGDGQRGIHPHRARSADYRDLRGKSLGGGAPGARDFPLPAGGGDVRNAFDTERARRFFDGRRAISRPVRFRLPACGHGRFSTGQRQAGERKMIP